MKYLKILNKNYQHSNNVSFPKYQKKKDVSIKYLFFWVLGNLTDLN